GALCGGGSDRIRPALSGVGGRDCPRCPSGWSGGRISANPGPPAGERSEWDDPPARESLDADEWRHTGPQAPEPADVLDPGCGDPGGDRGGRPGPDSGEDFKTRLRGPDG